MSPISEKQSIYVKWSYMSVSSELLTLFYNNNDVKIFHISGIRRTPHLQAMLPGIKFRPFGAQYSSLSTN